jgi:hypothetical protein
MVLLRWPSARRAEIVARHAESVVSYGRHQLGEAELPADSDPPDFALLEGRQDSGPHGHSDGMRDGRRQRPVVRGGIEFPLDRAVAEQRLERVGQMAEGQCVAARRPSSRPAAASRNAPAHTDTVQRAFSCSR